MRCCPAVSVVQIGAQNARHASLSPAPQVSHTGSHSSLLITSPCTPVLLATAPLRGPSAPGLSTEQKASAARHRSAAASSPRGTCLRDATTGAASVRCHRSIPTHCGTCLRFALAGAAHSRQPLPRQSVIGTFPHPRSAAAAVRCAGKATVPCSFLRSAALTLRSLLQIPAFCLSAQGITARLAAFLHTPTLCADRRTERQARLAAGGVFQSLLH